MYIENENDLVAYLMGNFKLGKYAMVSGISTIKISPDIDLLDINESQKIVTGYEFKLLRYRKNWKRVDFALMYKGIGQALSYFQFGVDKSYLILGMPKDVPIKSVSSAMKKIEETIEIFNLLKSLYARIREHRLKQKNSWYKALKLLIPEEHCGIGCFGIKVWTAHDNLLLPKLNAEEDFPIYLNEKLKHRKECLLRKEFRYDKNFLNRYKASRTGN